MEAEVPWEWDASVAPKAGSCEIAMAPSLSSCQQIHSGDEVLGREGRIMKDLGYLKPNNRELRREA